MTRYLMAVDPSLTCSGWAVFAIDTERVVAVGKVRGLPPPEALGVRLQELQSRVESLLERLGLDRRDALVCEAPTTMRDPHAALKVEQARCIFESSARARNLCVPGRINPRSVHFEVMGATGRQLKREVIKSMAVRTVLALYGAELEALGFPASENELKAHQDIVDAVLIGRLGLGRVRQAAISGASLPEIFGAETARQRQRRRMIG